MNKFNNQIIRLRPLTWSRNVYLHKGQRLAGLKKDPEQVFVNEQGLKYQDANNIQHIKQFVGPQYNISDDLALQVITHKSFANGIKPFNEKLSAIGLKLLNLYFAKYVIEQPSKTSTKNENTINGLNLDILGQPISKELSGRLSVGIFAKLNKLNSIMFWNSYSGQGLGFESSGELRVSAQMIYALIGAVHLTHGKKIAEEFISEKIVSEVENITREVIETEGKV